MAKSKKRWQDLTRGQRVAAVALGVLQVTLFVLAAVDLARRPASEVRGKKAWWTPVLGINTIGPLAYLVFGRTVPHADAAAAVTAAPEAA